MKLRKDVSSLYFSFYYGINNVRSRVYLSEYCASEIWYAARGTIFHRVSTYVRTYVRIYFSSPSSSSPSLFHPLESKNSERWYYSELEMVSWLICSRRQTKVSVPFLINQFINSTGAIINSTVRERNQFRMFQGMEISELINDSGSELTRVASNL